MNNVYHIKDKLNLQLNKDSIITIYLENKEIEIHYELSDGNYELLIFNNSNSNVSLKEDGYISNANVKITYLELNNNEFNQYTKIDLYKDANLNINAKYLGVSKKEVVYDLFNKDPNTFTAIDNKIVCLNNADYSLDVIGNISKGAKGSKCFQKSNCLTFENPKKARVLPILNIDEDDVEASHSLSSGTIDEEIMFYMNARGLDKKQALSLLLSSYLMPSADFYDVFEEGSKIQEIANKKVEELCVM